MILFYNPVNISFVKVQFGGLEAYDFLEMPLLPESFCYMPQIGRAHV